MDNTVARAFAVLEWLAAHPAPQRLTDIAAGVGLTKASVHRQLAILQELGYAARDEATSRYRVTLRIWEIGRGVVANTDLHTVAAPEMRSLASLAGESVALATLRDGYMVYIAQVESPSAIRAVARLGSHVPATAVALGKAVLAYSSHEALAQALARVEALTPRTLTRAEDIEADLRAVQERGYAISAGEWMEGMGGIGAPVFDVAGHVVAGLAVGGMEEDILGERQAMLAQLLLRSASEISRSLGYVGTAPSSGRVAFERRAAAGAPRPAAGAPPRRGAAAKHR